MLNFLIFSYLRAFKISCEDKLNMEKIVEPRALIVFVAK